MASNLIFKNAEEARDAITVSQKKEIIALYENWADEIGERAKYYSHKTTASAPVSERYYRELQNQIRITGQEVSNEIYSKIKANMYTIADAVVADNIKWLESFGFSPEGLNAAFSYVPDSVVRNLITGQIYDSGWSLSARIWGDNEQTLKDAYQIMAKGLAENKGIYEIAKDLESYVRPSAKLPWNPVLAMKNTKTGQIEYKRIYKKQVDYNAQRLARTLAQHSYQQSFIATTQKNPFITHYIWHSNGSRPCPLCLDRDGMPFAKDQLPMDHPNGMCTMEPAVADDMIDQLADWFNSPDGTYPEIDEFASNFGYNASKTGTMNDYLSKYGKSDKSWGAYVKSLSPIQKAEAKLLKDSEGLSWQKWYEKNIYTGTGPSANYKTTKAAVSKTVSKVDDVFDASKWYEKVKNNDVSKMDDWTKDWLKVISTTEKNGVVTYTGSAYWEMNQYLRSQTSSISSGYKSAIKQCKTALSKASLPEETIVRRGSSYNMLESLGFKNISPSDKGKVIGAIVEDKGFMSTSPASYGGFSKGIEYVIKVPKGSQAMYVDSISKHEGELELLINCGGQYKVEDVVFNEWGEVKKIFMSLINLK